jgi:hypothetical protein
VPQVRYLSVLERGTESLHVHIHRKRSLKVVLRVIYGSECTATHFLMYADKWRKEEAMSRSGYNPPSCRALGARLRHLTKRRHIKVERGFVRSPFISPSHQVLFLSDPQYVSMHSLLLSTASADLDLGAPSYLPSHMLAKFNAVFPLPFTA